MKQNEYMEKGNMFLGNQVGFELTRKAKKVESLDNQKEHLERREKIKKRLRSWKRRDELVGNLERRTIERAKQEGKNKKGG